MSLKIRLVIVVGVIGVFYAVYFRINHSNGGAPASAKEKISLIDQEIKQVVNRTNLKDKVDSKDGYVSDDGKFLVQDGIKYVMIDNEYYRYNPKNKYKLKDGRTVFYKDDSVTRYNELLAEKQDLASLGRSDTSEELTVQNMAKTLKNAKQNIKERNKLLKESENE